MMKRVLLACLVSSFLLLGFSVATAALPSSTRGIGVTASDPVSGLIP